MSVSSLQTPTSAGLFISLWSSVYVAHKGPVCTSVFTRTVCGLSWPLHRNISKVSLFCLTVWALKATCSNSGIAVHFFTLPPFKRSLDLFSFGCTWQATHKKLFKAQHYTFALSCVLKMIVFKPFFLRIIHFSVKYAPTHLLIPWL